jgi:hypothetical protein
VSWTSWLPTIVRSRPRETISLAYCTEHSPPTSRNTIVIEALRAAHVTDVQVDGPSWRFSLPWRTLVYGVIRRDLDEELSVSLAPSDSGWELQLRCEPIGTHNAHAAGAAGVLLVAGTVWLASGWTKGVLPGMTALIAGGIWADATRVMALTQLEKRLRRLIEDLGSALWPSAPAQVLPPPSRLGRR